MNKDDSQNPAQDDAELQKVLEGINGQSDGATLPTPSVGGLQFEETPGTTPVMPTDDNAANDTTGEPAAETQIETAPAEDTTIDPPVATPEEPEIPSVEVVADQPVYSSPVMPVASGPLEDIKKSALEQLRPLVDKLELPADEKFDTLLLIIRSTDDQSLVNAAYESAKLIEDENKRAQALLDVIKEIDYFANQK